jgi:voltage-gated potassium channel
VTDIERPARKHAGMRPRRRFTRLVQDFQEGPANVRNAIRLIVVATMATTLAGGVLVRIFDHRDFHNLGDAMWWALQTVTTVGYGDITPTNTVGRVIGAAILLYSVAFLTILTAAITTSFIEKARGRRQDLEDRHANVMDRLDHIVARLDRLEQRLADDVDGRG